MSLIETYLAILGDVVGSRHVEDREELRIKLRHGLRVIEGQPWLSSALAAPSTPPAVVTDPEISAGDEIQVLLRVEARRLPGAAAVGILDRLTDSLRPHRMAFGLGLGTLSTKSSGPVQQLDGSCFHRARLALGRAKREQRWAVVVASDADSPDPGNPVTAFEGAANAILRLTGEIRAGWTDRQIQVMRRFPVAAAASPLQKDVAEELGVSPSVISEMLRAARRDAVREAEHAVAVMLNRAASPESFRWMEGDE
jgi:SatD family (SatD)